MALPQKTGSMVKDANNSVVPLATGVVFQDATGSPVISPQAAVPTTAVALNVPANAVALVIKGAAAIRVGTNATLDGTAGKGYRTAGANVELRLPCAGVSAIYVRAETGTAAVDFHFETLA